MRIDLTGTMDRSKTEQAEQNVAKWSERSLRNMNTRMLCHECGKLQAVVSGSEANLFLFCGHSRTIATTLDSKVVVNGLARRRKRMAEIAEYQTQPPKVEEKSAMGWKL